MPHTIDLKKINGFGSLLNAYLDHRLSGLTAPLQTADIKTAIGTHRHFAHRELLHKVITKQYENLQVTGAVKNNIELLRNKNTFCITTGHQLTLMGGPLFVTYKILTTVKLARQYQQLFPDDRFVPVFWMATEDHDREEIDHFYHKGEKFTWETAQAGAVGRFSTTGITDLIEQFSAAFPQVVSPLLTVFDQAYKQPTLAAATRHLVNALFGEYGVVIIDGDEPDLKKIFLPVAEKEIEEKFVHRAVKEQNQALEKAGFTPPIHPREINLFLHIGHDRKRLEAEANVVRTADGDLQWDKQDFIGLIRKNPAQISPNVLLRPVYQEMILPNLAYVGGPAEIEYWLQLDKVFDVLGIKMPARTLRICATVIQPQESERLSKTGLPPELFLGDEDRLIKYFLDQAAGQNLDFSDETVALETLFGKLAQKAEKVDPTLGPAVMAEKTRQEKALENIFGRIRKAEKSKHEIEINRLKKLRQAFLPGGKLQERTFTLLDIPGNEASAFFDKVSELELNTMNLLVL